MELTRRSGQLKIRTREARLFNRKFCINQAITLFAVVKRPRDLVDVRFVTTNLEHCKHESTRFCPRSTIYAFEFDTVCKMVDVKTHQIWFLRLQIIPGIKP